MALVEPVAPDFVKVSLNETNRIIVHGSDLWACHGSDNETSQLDIDDQLYVLLLPFILNRFDKIKNQQEDTKKYERSVNTHRPIWVEIDTIKWPSNRQYLDNAIVNTHPMVGKSG